MDAEEMKIIFCMALLTIIFTGRIHAGIYYAEEACGVSAVCNCTPYDTGVDVICANRGLTEVPGHLPLNASKIRLSRNNITEVPFESFQGLTRLFMLYLDDNEISSIARGAFDSLENLKILSITHNELQRVPERMLYNLGKLENVHLSWNMLKEVPECFFQTSTAIETLSLSHSMLIEIPGNLLNRSERLKKLDFSWNMLKEIPENLFRTSTAIEALILSHNLLEKIPQKLFYGLTRLRKLYLAYNKLIRIEPYTLWSQHSLHLFDVSRNQLQELPNFIFADTSALILIDLSKNNLSILHEDVFATTPNVQQINISSNALQHIPTRLFGNKSSLQSLDICCNHIQDLPEEILASTNGLRSIYFYSNQIQTLPPTLFSSTPRLRSIHAGQNRLDKIPANILSGLPELYFVDFCSNRIKTLPEDLFIKNIQMKTIKFTENILEEIPPALFATLIHLKTVYLKRNMLRRIHEDLFRFNPSITKLWLSFNKLDKIPGKLFANTSNLNQIDLSYNELQEVPAQLFRKTHRVQKINLSNNKLHEIPPNLFSYTPELQYLELDRNYLKEMPESLLMSTPKLESIDIGNNSLSKVPSEMFRLTPKLRVLKMSNNEFKSLPNFLATTPNLRTFVATNNKLETIPANLFRKTTLLSHLDLSSNQITEIPSNLFNETPELTNLILHNNKISNLPNNVFRRTSKLKYLDFASNRIGELSKEMLNGTSTIIALSAAGNEITVITADVFSYICLLNKLDVSQNQIRIIPEGLFLSNKVQHKLQILFFQRNSIEYISKKAFAGLYFIEYILLYNNKIHILYDGAFMQTSVKTIYLFGNNLSEIVGNPFQNENITELHLYGNKIKAVSEESILGLKCNTTDIYMDCGELTKTPWAPKHVIVKCVGPAFVPTINISLAAVPTALRSQGFSCTINKRGFSQCEPCRPGTFGDGTRGCSPCPAGGFYQDDIGQAASFRRGMACKDCNIGTFVKEGRGISISECLVCPEGTNQTTKAGFRACFCKENYARTDRFGPCELCTEEGINCISQEYKSIQPGYYWNWTFDEANLTKYSRFAENLQDESRFYNEHFNYSGQIPKVFKCERSSNCLNNGSTILQRIEGTCETGYRGWMCSKCKAGFYSVLNSCILCPGRVWMLIEPIAVITLCILFYLIILWQYQQDKKSSKNERSVMDVIVSRIKIVLGFYQVVGEFFTSLHDVNWTGILRVIGEAISSVELTILRVLVRPQCYNSRLEINPKIEFIIGTSLPFAIFIGALSFFQLKRCYNFYKRRKGVQHVTDPDLNEIKERLFTIVLVLLFISYPPICSVIFQLYPRACKTFCLDRNDGVCINRLRSDYDINCEELHLYHLLAYIATAVYVVPFPLILLILLRKHCYNKNHTGVSINQGSETLYGSSSKENSPLLQRDTFTRSTRSIPVWLLFLCENYKPQYWYWEIVELSRKVAQTLLITLLGWEDKVTVLITIGISVLFLTMHARFWPMKDLFDQRLQMFSLSAIFINVLVAAMQVPDSYEGAISITLVLLNIVVMLILAVQMALGFIRHVRKIKLVQRFLYNVRNVLSRCMQRKR